MKSTVNSILYKRISIPGSLEGIIRVINRSDEPELSFTNTHLELLERMSGPVCAYHGRKIRRDADEGGG